MSNSKQSFKIFNIRYEYYEELYSLRYEEFIALNTHMIQKLMAQVQSLENEIEELKRGNDNNE